MHMNTIKQELYKKIARMSRRSFDNFILDLEKHYRKTHGQDPDDLTWPECDKNTFW